MFDLGKLEIEVVQFLEKTQIASTCEIGIFLTGNGTGDDYGVPSRKQLEAILEIMNTEKRILRIRKIKEAYFHEGFDISEEVTRNFLWAHPTFAHGLNTIGGQ